MVRIECLARVTHLVETKGDDYADCKNDETNFNYGVGAVADGVTGSEDDLDKYGVAKGGVAAEYAVTTALEVASRAVEYISRLGDEYTPIARLDVLAEYMENLTYSIRTMTREDRVTIKEKLRSAVRHFKNNIIKLFRHLVLEEKKEPLLISVSTLIYAILVRDVGLVAGYVGDGYLYLVRCKGEPRAAKPDVRLLMLPHATGEVLQRRAELRVDFIDNEPKLILRAPLAQITYTWRGVFDDKYSYAVILGSDGTGLDTRIATLKWVERGGARTFEIAVKDALRVAFSKKDHGEVVEFLEESYGWLSKGSTGDPDALETRLIDIVAVASCGVLQGRLDSRAFENWLETLMAAVSRLKNDDASIVVIGLRRA